MLLSIPQAAEALGGVNPRWVWDRIADGSLRSIKIGPRTTRVSTEELARFIRSKMDDPADDVA